MPRRNAEPAIQKGNTMEKIEADIFNILHNTKIRLQGDAEDNYGFMGKGYAEKLAIEIAKEIQPSEKTPHACKCNKDRAMTVKRLDDGLFQCPRCSGIVLGQPSEKKALSVDMIVEIFRSKMPLLDQWTYEQVSQAIFDALPAQREVRYPSVEDEVYEALAELVYRMEKTNFWATKVFLRAKSILAKRKE